MTDRKDRLENALAAARRARMVNPFSAMGYEEATRREKLAGEAREAAREAEIAGWVAARKRRKLLYPAECGLVGPPAPPEMYFEWLGDCPVDL